MQDSALVISVRSSALVLGRLAQALRVDACELISPPRAATTRNAVFVITEQTITDQAKYEKDFQQQAAKTIKDAGGRFIVRTTEVTSLTGEPPKRVVVLGFESIDEVKKWQGGEYAKLIPIRDQIRRAPQGAKPGQNKYPN